MGRYLLAYEQIGGGPPLEKENRINRKGKDDDVCDAKRKKKAFPKIQILFEDDEWVLVLVQFEKLSFLHIENKKKKVREHNNNNNTHITTELSQRIVSVWQQKNKRRKVKHDRTEKSIRHKDIQCMDAYAMMMWLNYEFYVRTNEIWERNHRCGWVLLWIVSTRKIQNRGKCKVRMPHAALMQNAKVQSNPKKILFVLRQINFHWIWMKQRK